MQLCVTLSGSRAPASPAAGTGRGSLCRRADCGLGLSVQGHMCHPGIDAPRSATGRPLALRRSGACGPHLSSTHTGPRPTDVGRDPSGSMRIERGGQRGEPLGRRTRSAMAVSSRLGARVSRERPRGATPMTRRHHWHAVRPPRPAVDRRTPAGGVPNSPCSGTPGGCVHGRRATLRWPRLARDPSRLQRQRLRWNCSLS